MIKPWFVNILLVIAVVVASGRFVDVVGRRTDPVPEVTPAASEPRVHPVAKRTTRKEDFQDVVDKNLFDPGRGKAEPAADAPPTVAPTVTQPPKATLFGIMVDPEGNKYAFLTDDKAGTGAKAKRYREGDNMSGARIKEIRPDRVIFTVGSTEHVVALRAPKEGMDTYQPPPTVPGAGVRRPGVGRSPQPRRPAAQRQRPPTRRPAPVRGRTVPPPDGDGFEQFLDEEAIAPGENPFEDNPFADNPFEENPFGENPFEENIFGDQEEW